MGKEKPQSELEIREIQADMIMTGFSPIFTRKLLEKLKQLKEEKRLLETKMHMAYGTDSYYPLTSIGRAVIVYLQNQLLFLDIQRDIVSVADIDELITTTEKLLATFEIS